ncbi:MAG TPA: metallophosphoesterase [Planctomycetota bacterium]
MSPYLQAATASSIYVMVESDSEAPVSVDFGETTSYGQRASTESLGLTASGTYVHRVKLAGLKAGSAYYYRASQGDAVSAGASFRTLVDRGQPFRFAWMADCRTGTDVHDGISARILSAQPLFSLYGGDLCSDGTRESFMAEFFRPNELALDASVPFFNSPGNHEGWGTNTRAFQQAPDSASGTQDFYSFDCGDLHVLVLNAMTDAWAGSPQYKFAQADLSASAKPWKIVTFHTPAYCSGGHGEDPAFKAMTTDIFEPTGVTLVLAGHSHFYQHNLVNGIHHLVVGSAGAPLYDPIPAPYTVTQSKSYCYAVADVSVEALRLSVYNDQGVLLDKLNLLQKEDIDGDGFLNEIELALGSDPEDPNSTPRWLPSPTPSSGLSVSRADVQLDLAHFRRDRISLRGAVPLDASFNPEGQRVIVDFGGVVDAFVLDGKGASVPNKPSFKIGRPGKGNSVGFVLNLQQGNFASVLGSAKLKTQSMKKDVRLTFIIGGKVFDQKVSAKVRVIGH